MTFMALVVWITDSSMRCQLTSVVEPSFGWEDFKIFCTNFAVKELMGFSNVFLKLMEVHKQIVIVAFRAAKLEQMIKSLLNL